MNEFENNLEQQKKNKKNTYTSEVDILNKAQHDELKRLVNVKTAKSDTHERVSFYLTDSHPARDGGGRAQCVVRVYSFIISSKGELLP